MTDLVWALLEDGPVAGFVAEVDCTARELQIDFDGIHHYRRKGWEKDHRIARYTFTKTLVV